MSGVNLDVGPSSSHQQNTMYWANNKTTLAQYLVSHLANVVLMLDHRLRRWPNIKTTLE